VRMRPYKQLLLRTRQHFRSYTCIPRSLYSDSRCWNSNLASPRGYGAIVPWYFTWLSNLSEIVFAQSGVKGSGISGISRVSEVQQMFQPRVKKAMKSP